MFGSQEEKDLDPFPDPTAHPSAFLRMVSMRSSWGRRIIPTDVFDIDLEDLINPYNRFTLLTYHPDQFIEWLGGNGLLATDVRCDVEGCRKECRLNRRTSSIDGYSWRCRPGGEHEHSLRKFSFFSHSHLYLQDIFLFVMGYAERNGSLGRLACWSGINYSSTSIDWGVFIREMFMAYVHRLLQNDMLSGEVEIDESQFGRKVKANKGNPQKGRKVWVVGLVQRSNNNILLFPVDDRTKTTLHWIVCRYVRRGSKIYTDEWAAYGGLQELGYEHFSVSHKHSYRVDYVNVSNGEVESCTTNRVEGSWKQAKVRYYYICRLTMLE